jgi:IclR family transcriptional regulator, KDG regulon repressor
MAPKQCFDNRNNINQTLLRGLSALEILAEADDEMGVRDLSRLLGLGPPMAQRILNTLLCRGFVEQNSKTRKYSIGHQTFVVGRKYVTANGLIETALSVLRRVVDETQLNAYIGELANGYAVYLLVLQSRGPIAVRATPGERASLHSTAMGKALLAAMDRAEIVRLIKANPLTAKTPKTITKLPALLSDLELVRSRGFAISDEENLPGVFAAGAGIQDALGRTTAAISFACPTAQADKSTCATICDQAKRAAMEISMRLGAIR